MTEAQAGSTSADEELVARFVGRAKDELRGATLSELLAFLTVRRVAPGSALARFYEAFPKDADGPTGRDALIERLRKEAVSPPEMSVTSEVILELLRLQHSLENQSDEAGEGLRMLAQRDFDTYAYGESQRAGEILRTLMVAVARADDIVREDLARFYASLAETYSGAYEQLLAAMGRQPIPEIGTVENFGRVITALMDGLLVRAAFDEPENVRNLLRATIVPLLGALTYPIGFKPPEDRDHLFDVPPLSATIRYPRTPTDAQALSADALADLQGTWQGTMKTERVLRDVRGGSGLRETYLVLDDSTGRLQATNFVEGGLSRMVMPQFFAVGHRRRMTCLYEAEVGTNLQPESPSHRGAWILEVDQRPAQHLTATYFTDRSTRGEFRFTRRLDTYANSFLDARAMFASWKPDEEL